MILVHCATTSKGKLREFREAGAPVGCQVELLPGLTSIEAPEEDGTTFEENAILKARYYSGFTKEYIFADDSGLEVDALGGAPGVYSARYAGGAGDAANNALLLKNLGGIENRTARFVCVIALVRQGELFGTFRGKVEGSITHAPSGAEGFGYDPLFYYPPFGCTFGVATIDQKMGVSHRGAALRALFDYLHSISHAISIDT